MVFTKLNIYESCNKAYGLYKLLGFTPYQLYHNPQKLIAGKRNVLLNIILISTMVVVSISGVAECIIYNQKLPRTKFMLDDSWALLRMVTIITMYVNAQATARKIVGLFDEFKTFDKRLSRLMDQMHLYLAERNLVWWLYWIRYFGFTTGFLSQGFYRWYTGDDMVILCLISHYIQYMVMAQTVFMYTVFINECWKRFNCLSIYLLTILVRNKMISCVGTTLLPKANTCYKLEKIRHIYEEIEDLAIKTNCIFQIPILAKNLVVIINILPAAYLIAEAFIALENTELFYATHYVFWTICWFGEVALDIYVYENMRQEVSLT